MNSTAPRSYRRDVDGLRGLAIALVVIFHVFVGRVSSGVDVFLLVGGIFFFGPQIRNALSPTGQTLVQSVVRLLRRLYPALLTVVTVTMVAGLVVYSRPRWVQTAQDAAASLLYRQNFHLASQGQDYAAVGRDVSLYQHIWSMSAQLQIYLASLVVIVVVAWLVRRWRRDGSGVRAVSAVTVLHLLLVVATAASFVYAVYLHSVDQGWNYYSPVSRFWEIGLGGLLGIWLVNRELPAGVARFRVPAGIVGVVLIIATGLFLDGAAQFPGPLTLIPLTGATLVILAGNPVADRSDRSDRADRSGELVGVSAVLVTRPFQFLGRVSYSLYLWHWPLLVLATFHFSTVTGPTRTAGVQGITATLGPRRGVAVGVAVIVLSLALAWLTQRYIETPLREARKPTRSWWPASREALRSRPAVAVVGTAVVVSAAVVSTGPVMEYRENARLSAMDAEDLDPAQYPGPRAFLEDAPVPSDVPVRPDLSSEKHMLPPTQDDGCYARFSDTDIVLTHDFNDSSEPCVYGDVNSRRTIYLAGGSHSEHYLPALDVVAKSQHIRIVPILKMGCVLGMPLPRLGGDEYPECAEWDARAQQYIFDNPPTDGVFMTVTRPTTIEGDGPDQTPTEYVDMVRKLSDAGIHTWGVRDTPWNMQAPGEQGNGRLCVAEGLLGDGPGQDCGTDLNLAMAEVNPALVALDGLDVTEVDLTDSMCRDGRCPAVVGNVLVYRDGQHFTDVFSQMLGPELERQMFDPDAVAAMKSAQEKAVADNGGTSGVSGELLPKDVRRMPKPGEEGYEEGYVEGYVEGYDAGTAAEDDGTATTSATAATTSQGSPPAQQSTVDGSAR